MRSWQSLALDAVEGVNARDALRAMDDYLRQVDWAFGRILKGEMPTSVGLPGGGATPMGGGVSDHGLLSGLTDDDHAQYALLAGRTSGQVLYGGTTATGSLRLVSSSACATGAIYIVGVNPCVGIGINPAEFDGGAGIDSKLLISANKAVGSPALTILPTDEGGVATLFQIIAQSTGSPPNRALNLNTYLFKMTKNGRFYVGNGSEPLQSFWIASPSGQFTVGMNDGFDSQILASWAASMWSDAVTSTYLYVGTGSGGTRRAMLASSSGFPFDRLGISSLWTSISDGTVGVITPPTALLHLRSTVAAASASAVLQVESSIARTGHLTYWANSAGASAAVDASARFIGDSSLLTGLPSSGVTLDTNQTITGQKTFDGVGEASTIFSGDRDTEVPAFIIHEYAQGDGFDLEVGAGIGGTGQAGSCILMPGRMASVLAEVDYMEGNTAFVGVPTPVTLKTNMPAGAHNIMATLTITHNGLAPQSDPITLWVHYTSKAGDQTSAVVTADTSLENIPHSGTFLIQTQDNTTVYYSIEGTTAISGTVFDYSLRMER